MNPTVPTVGSITINTVGTVTDGKTYQLNGDRVTEGTVVHTSDGDYVMKNGVGVKKSNDNYQTVTVNSNPQPSSSGGSTGSTSPGNQKDLPGVHLPLIKVYINRSVTLQEAEGIVSLMNGMLFMGEIWQGLNGYFYPSEGNEGISTLNVDFIYKSYYSYSFAWDVSKDTWKVGYNNSLWQPYTPTPTNAASTKNEEQIPKET